MGCGCEPRPAHTARILVGRPAGLLAEYAGSGLERLVVLACGPQTLAWVGIALGERDYEVLPGDGGAEEK